MTEQLQETTIETGLCWTIKSMRDSLQFARVSSSSNLTAGRSAYEAGCRHYPKARLRQAGLRGVVQCFSRSRRRHTPRMASAEH